MWTERDMDKEKKVQSIERAERLTDSLNYLKTATEDTPVTLYRNEWLSLKKLNNYTYSHQETGDTISILVFDSSKPNQIYGRFEECPAHQDGISLCSITGTIDHNEDPIDAAQRELLEESGYDAQRQDIITLGTVRIYKASDATVHLYAIDVKGLTPSTPKGDGSIHEAQAYCKWVSDRDAINCKDPLMATLIARLRLEQEFIT
jgi:hypothetical protein